MKTNERTRLAMLTLVMPRFLMNIAGQPVPFLLRSSSDLPHVVKATQGLKNLEVDHLPTLVVLHDSLETPPMALTKPKRNVGPQGHNGLRAVEKALGTRDFWRIGLGIGRPLGGKSRGDGITEWVLGDIKSDSDERIFWEGEGVAAIRRYLDQIAETSARPE
ncbi:hypothetical protein NliqN6_3168 [Naganishia liquefaciens]|uniref:Peptidyl-tRNA hydrolase n=1 Tax=Naganishia liquefaciens TaxID=104408 RepID=A0A8H3TTQ3_9TREE|nr:hypothetical protein NliqN6_3168 [Naganishia liquefaciens]